jgi:hypothetical protein
MSLQTQILQGRAFDNFVNAIKSPKTKVCYVTSLKRYLNFLKLKEVDPIKNRAQSINKFEHRLNRLTPYSRLDSYLGVHHFEKE